MSRTFHAGADHASTDSPQLPRLLRQRKRKQRGIILLMVVSLLALFLLMGVTFAILAIQYKYAADTQAQRQRYGDPLVNEADLVLEQTLYESLTPTSLSGHGHLRDMYGNDYLQYPTNFGNVTDNAFNVQRLTNNNQGNGQLLEITFNSSLASAPTLGSASRVPGYYNGRVLTIYSSTLGQWVSGRVVQYVAPTGGNTTARLYVENPVGDYSTQPFPNASTTVAPFVVNGAPFNGAGAGFDPIATANNLNAVERGFGLPVALLPHYSAYESKQAYHINDTNFNNGFSVEIGGADEPYDTAGFQDMRIAFIPPRVVIDTLNNPLIPSYHRPDLINFWINHAVAAVPGGGNSNVTYNNIGAANPNDPNFRHLMRRVILRPMPWDNEHPTFSGSNPDLDRNRASVQQILARVAQQGGWSAIWDVDNDGDGIRDSVWIDPGLPVLTAPNGRRYKRLAAILTKDLDSRANLNVHGNQNYASNSTSRASTSLTLSAGSAPPFLLAGQPAAGSVDLPRGLGFGPAEVDFCNILGGYATAGGVYSNLLSSRYGSDGVPGASGDDAFSQVKQLGMPRPNGNHTSELSIYSTPPDVWGRGAVAMDYWGQPAWYNIGTSEITDDPYEMQFDPRTAINDAPFTAADQEHLSRFLDPTMVGHSSRLMQVAQSALGTTPSGQFNPQEHIRRESLTTISTHAGGPRTFWRNDGRMQPINNGSSTTVRQGLSVLDLYYQRLQSNTNFAVQWRTIVPWEMMHGEAFNINRLFGNGSQDQTMVDNLALGNTRAIIDDPSEGTYGLEQIYSMYPFEHHNDDPNRPAVVNPETPPGGEYFPLNARITYARHLYCLLMLIKNNTGGNINVDADGDGTPGTARDTAFALAQYAVNVVDFRDNDAIHTGFEFDTQPFDSTGWDVDGYLSTTNDPAAAANQRGVVWGVERPELLITEAIAFHDRRTENTQEGAPNTMETTVDAANPMMRDDDYDQRLRPKGRLFIELFNPWVDRANNVYDHKPSELYYNGGVRLDATAADNRTPGTPTPGIAAHPVWRIMITRNDNAQMADPDSPTPGSMEQSAAADIDRTVYFVNPSALPAAMWAGDNANSRFYPSIAGITDFAPVMPGRYAVIGSSGVTSGNDYISYVGRPTTSSSYMDFPAGTRAQTRRFVLTPNANPNTNQFQVLGNADPEVDTTQNQPVVAIPINMPRSLNVSEPLAGYPGAVGAATWQNLNNIGDEPDGGEYNPAMDTPLDKQRANSSAPGDADDAADAAFMLSDGTREGYRLIFLQRLANPTVPWHPQMNPYITIDSSSVDLTSFNGLVNDGNDPANNNPPTVNFQSFQRGGTTPAVGGFTPAPPATTRNLWEATTPHTGVTAASPAEAGTLTQHYFPREVIHTFGFLNARYGPGFTTGTAPTNAYVGAPTPAAGNTATFPWLVHANRPFMSPIELLHVSGKSPSQLLRGYTVSNGAATNAYLNTQSTDPLFAHLVNFLTTNAAPGTIGAADGPLLARLMDYVETPEPFVGSERYYNPAHFSSSASPGANVPTSTYRPPFGKMSRFRDPGRININGLSEFEVWNALGDSYQPWGNTTNPNTAIQVFLSRQGYPNPGGSSALWGEMHPNYPTIFANPFRPAEAADLMPVVQNSSGTTIVDMRRREADATLMRRYGNAPDPNKPLFAGTALGVQPAHTDPGRSPYMRYQLLQKIANNVSYNSNCYATWITIGYFEVDDNPGGADAAHPDGYRLGQELGLDEGNTQRHRSFYLIDRSIPVGFIPGVKLNADDCVLLRRQID